MLPASIKDCDLVIIKDHNYYIKVIIKDHNYYIKYEEQFPDLYDLPKRIVLIDDTNLANACAKMLIYLIENGLYEVKK